MDPKIDLHKLAGESQSASNWERDAIIKLATAGLREQRRARRWGVFFKLLGFGLIAVIIVSLVDWGFTDLSTGGSHTALVELTGIIADGEEASANNVISGLRAAFENEGSVAVVLKINSPGGSPVQASYINREITRLRGHYPEKPLYAVVSDICASGGMFAAVAADKIYANKASIVGSIGVRLDGFGFVGTLDKLGIERRLMTAGKHKAILDPFSPEDSFGKEHMQKLLDEIHQQFIDVIKKGRGDRLANGADLFSGLFWTGEQALGLGLVDAFGDVSYVARDVVGVEEIRDYTYREDIFQRFAEQLGSALVRPVREAMLHPSLK